MSKRDNSKAIFISVVVGMVFASSTLFATWYRPKSNGWGIADGQLLLGLLALPGALVSDIAFGRGAGAAGSLLPFLINVVVYSLIVYVVMLPFRSDA